MYITKKYITLASDTYENIYMYNEQQILEIFKEELKKYINNINQLLNTDFKKLSNNDFYDLLSKIYNISLDEKDYLKIISKINNKKYNKFIKIETSMTFTSTTSEGKGKNFSWWEQLYQVIYTVAVAENYNIDNNHIFSKKELKKMIDDKNIIIIDKDTKPLDIEPIFEKEVAEEFSILDLKNSKNSKEIIGSIYKDENFPIVVSMLRKIFNKKKILRDMKEYIQELQIDIDEILLNKSENYPTSEIISLCNKWFENSKEKQIYKKLLTKFNSN